ncbi:unnamed protein product [Oncorhynchus mykiss]|uniref:Uncharacterized protein n=1 Tax=Oncorhynchus mykiss TaxID=8022 RepID=A0A060YWY0_ONCMY|nr:unnamed protein product [Oncorhynchus mykiss]
MENHISVLLLSIADNLHSTSFGCFCFTIKTSPINSGVLVQFPLGVHADACVVTNCGVLVQFPLGVHVTTCVVTNCGVHACVVTNCGVLACVVTNCGILVQFPLGVHAAACVRVGNALGAGDTSRALLTCKVALVLSGVLAVFQGIAIGNSRHVLGYIFTSDQ